jgi:antitoxin ParD1/3/4
MSLNVSLTPELEELVRAKVSSGQYGSASEVVREALRLLIERDEQLQARLVTLRAALRDGLEQLDEGRSVPLDVERIKRAARARLERHSEG